MGLENRDDMHECLSVNIFQNDFGYVVKAEIILLYKKLQDLDSSLEKIALKLELKRIHNMGQAAVFILIRRLIQTT